jgi:hypothetical protein
MSNWPPNWRLDFDVGYFGAFVSSRTIVGRSRPKASSVTTETESSQAGDRAFALYSAIWATKCSRIALAVSAVVDLVSAAVREADEPDVGVAHVRLIRTSQESRHTAPVLKQIRGCCDFSGRQCL